MGILDQARASAGKRLPVPSANGEDIKPEVEMSWPDPIQLIEEQNVLEFPVDVLPDQLKQFAIELAWSMNAPIDFVGVSILTLAAGAIGNTYRLRISETHSQPALIYAALVGPPGTAKSPVLKHLTKPFDEIQSKWNEEYRVEMERWESSEKAERKERPHIKMCIARNFTAESLALLMHHNPRGFVAALDELSSLFSGMNQYKGGNGSDRQVYLSIWAQDTISVHRKTDLQKGIPSIWSCNPCLSIVGGIQPDMLGSIRGRGSFRGEPPPDDGGLDRFLFAWPKVLPEIADEGRTVSRALLAVWPDAIGNIINYLDGDGQPVNLSTKARAVWFDFTKRHAAGINTGETPEYLRGPWSKLKGYVLRLALTLHLLRWACGEQRTINVLDDTAMVRALSLITYFKSHATKLHGSIGSDVRMEGARKVLKWIRQLPHNRFSGRGAFQSLKGTFKTMDALDQVLELLEAHLIIRPESQPDRHGPGRKPSPWYQVNPKLALMKPPNSENSGNSGSENKMKDSGPRNDS